MKHRPSATSDLPRARGRAEDHMVAHHERHAEPLPGGARARCRARRSSQGSGRGPPRRRATARVRARRGPRAPTTLARAGRGNRARRRRQRRAREQSRAKGWGRSHSQSWASVYANGGRSARCAIARRAVRAAFGLRRRGQVAAARCATTWRPRPHASMASRTRPLVRGSLLRSHRRQKEPAPFPTPRRKMPAFLPAGTTVTDGGTPPRLCG